MELWASGREMEGARLEHFVLSACEARGCGSVRLPVSAPVGVVERVATARGACHQQEQAHQHRVDGHEEVQLCRWAGDGRCGEAVGLFILNLRAAILACSDRMSAKDVYLYFENLEKDEEHFTRLYNVLYERMKVGLLHDFIRVYAAAGQGGGAAATKARMQ